MIRRVPVLLPLPLAGVLDYRLPDDVVAEPGAIVVVPLNGRDQVGVVWDGPTDEAFPAGRLKPVRGVLSDFRFTPTLRQFIDWVANYTLSAPGDVLAMALRVNALTPDRIVTGLRCLAVPGRLTPARRRVLEALGDDVMAASELVQRAAVSRPILYAMVRSHPAAG